MFIFFVLKLVLNMFFNQLLAQDKNKYNYFAIIFWIII